MARSRTEPPLSPTHCYPSLWCQHEQRYVFLPYYHHLTNHCLRRLPIIIPVLLLTLAGLVYACWPSDPTLKIVGLRLNKIHTHAVPTLPIIKVDISLQLTIKVRNVDVYSMDFRSLDVAVKYRWKKLGHVRSDHGHVRAQASSYVDAELEFNGVSIVSDVVALLDDLARGTVPFRTDAEVHGKLGMLFFGFPVKAKMSCEVLLNTNNQTIVSQNCPPENEFDGLEQDGEKAKASATTAAERSMSTSEEGLGKFET